MASHLKRIWDKWSPATKVAVPLFAGVVVLGAIAMTTIARENPGAEEDMASASASQASTGNYRPGQNNHGGPRGHTQYKNNIYRDGYLPYRPYLGGHGYHGSQHWQTHGHYGDHDYGSGEADLGSGDTDDSGSSYYGSSYYGFGSAQNR